MDCFVFSDIHGQKELFNKILNWLNGRSEPWKCYFLGDACDRGRHGFEIIKTLLSDDRFICLKGNHEDLFVRAARALRKHWEENKLTYEQVAANPYENIIEHEWDWDVSIHIQNGGLPTLLDWAKCGKTGLEIINRIDALPTHIELPDEVWGKLDLSHAGHPMNDLSDSAFLWNREHFSEKFEGGRMIHGHTPIRSMVSQGCLPPRTSICKPAFYQDNTKICMDTACFFTGFITLMNLHTCEQHRFGNAIIEEEK